MMRIKEKTTGKLVFVGEEENLASFDPHLHGYAMETYGKGNVGSFTRYIDRKGWEAEMGHFRLTEEDRRFIEKNRDSPPMNEKN